MPAVQKTIFAKKLLYQSSHRGCKETDFILGKFAEKFLPSMNIEQLQLFAKILEQNDSDIYDWVTGKSVPPIQLQSSVMDKLLKFKPN